MNTLMTPEARRQSLSAAVAASTDTLKLHKTIDTLHRVVQQANELKLSEKDVRRIGVTLSNCDDVVDNPYEMLRRWLSYQVTERVQLEQPLPHAPTMKDVAEQMKGLSVYVQVIELVTKQWNNRHGN